MIYQRPETLNFAFLGRRFDTSEILTNFDSRDIDVRLEQALQDMEALQKAIRILSEQKDIIQDTDFDVEVRLKRNKMSNQRIRFILLVEKVPRLSPEHRKALGDYITPRVHVTTQVWPGKSHKDAMESALKMAAKYGTDVILEGFGDLRGGVHHGAKNKAGVVGACTV